MRTTHLIILTMAAVSLMGCNPKETVNALTSDQNVTQKMAVRFAENMVGLPRALVVSDARKAAPGDKVTVKGAVIGDDPVFYFMVPRYKKRLPPVSSLPVRPMENLSFNLLTTFFKASG